MHTESCIQNREEIRRDEKKRFAAAFSVYDTDFLAGFLVFWG